jgi:hypothetical protein
VRSLRSARFQFQRRKLGCGQSMLSLGTGNLTHVLHMKKLFWWLILATGLVLLAAIIFFAMRKPAPTSAPPPAAAPPAPVASAEPQIRYPLAQKPPEKPLPALDVSDSTMKNALGELSGDKTFIEFFQVKDFVRRVVATVDNLPRQKIALRLLPVKLAGGQFVTTGEPGAFTIDAGNAARYAPFLKLVESIDTGKLVALYVHFYPLFQQAYQDLGYPKAYFNDRLVEVIDHLLSAPEVQAPVKLVRPKVFYLYADPELEARSAGQKIMMRVGNDNAARIKAKLREIRNEVIRQAIKK